MIILSKYGNFCTWQAYFANMLIFSIYANLMQIMQNFAYIYANYAKFCIHICKLCKIRIGQICKYGNRACECTRYRN